MRCRRVAIRALLTVATKSEVAASEDVVAVGGAVRQKGSESSRSKEEAFKQLRVGCGKEDGEVGVVEKKRRVGRGEGESSLAAGEDRASRAVVDEAVSFNHPAHNRISWSGKF